MGGHRLSVLAHELSVSVDELLAVAVELKGGKNLHASSHLSNKQASKIRSLIRRRTGVPSQQREQAAVVRQPALANTEIHGARDETRSAVNEDLPELFARNDYLPPVATGKIKVIGSRSGEKPKEKAQADGEASVKKIRAPVIRLAELPEFHLPAPPRIAELPQSLRPEISLPGARSPKLGDAAPVASTPPTGSVRIYALAKELKVDSFQLFHLCTKAGITEKYSPLASLESDEINRLKAYLSDNPLPPFEIPSTLRRGPVRIYALAKDLKVDSRELVDICTKAGITGKGSALASIDSTEIGSLMAYLGGNPAPPAEVDPASPLAHAGKPKTFVRDDYIAAIQPPKVSELPQRDDEFHDNKPQDSHGEHTFSKAVRSDANESRPDDVAIDESPVIRLEDTETPATVASVSRIRVVWPEAERLSSANLRAKANLHFPSRLLRNIAVWLKTHHILLTGPPGTGKTELAKAIPHLLFEDERNPYVLATAHSAWTAYDLIGGLTLLDGTASFTQGVFTEAVSQSIDNGGRTWLILDEINRADIDRAMGPMFTALEDFVLNVHLDPHSGLSTRVVIPSAFRVIATMNTADKNHLFPMSNALKRRFAIIEVMPVEGSDQDKLLQESLKSFLEQQGTISERDVQQVLSSPQTTKLISALCHLFDNLRAQARRPDAIEIPELMVGTATVTSVARFVVAAILHGGDEERVGELIDDALMAALMPQLEGLSVEELAAVEKVFDESNWELPNCIRRLSYWQSLYIE